MRTLSAAVFGCGPKTISRAAGSSARAYSFPRESGEAREPMLQVGGAANVDQLGDHVVNRRRL
jgi:hypothetical protein